MDPLRPTELSLLVDVGFWAMDEQMPHEAEAIFRHLASVQQANPYPRIGLAMLAWAGGRKEQALRSLREVLQDHPQAVFTRGLLAKFMKESGLPGWEAYAREVTERVQTGAAADLARGLLQEARLGEEPVAPMPTFVLPGRRA